MPKFQGSNNYQDYSDYIGRNIIYPPMAHKYGIEGRVLINFIINSLGQVCNIKVHNTVHKDLEKEAMRVVSQSPDWIPGYQKGKAVSVEFTVPINFIFQ